MKVEEGVRESFSTALYVLVGILLALGVNMGMAFFLATDMPVVAVESNSMIPTFQRGDLLILQGIPADQIQIDDIIVFIPSQRTTAIVHRVIELNPDGTFQTQGDANPQQLPFEESISFSNIHGKVVTIIPLLGWVRIGVVDYIRPNWYWVVLAAIIAYGLYIAYKKIFKRKGYSSSKGFIPVGGK